MLLQPPLGWFAPRYSSSSPSLDNSLCHQHNASSSSASLLALENESLAGYAFETVNSTAKALAGAVVDKAQKRFFADPSCPPGAAALNELQTADWTNFGLEWLRSLVGRREWTLPCVDVKVRL
ncbi:hypothetical protein AOCH_000431 [Aspergillus ochraceoroseus]|uniref:Uncharacterized protein n=1 Tax=Aspergillus ochraceoroseus TaxID=138278 RepID=A0A0F8WMA0_9EURO|nr:hypothetical protein AOCH_000431 [Aspergillus ochraceoroseus]